MHVVQSDIGGRRRASRAVPDAGGDWMRVWSVTPEVQKVEAYFRGASYGMHRHDTYAVGLTTFGVQSIRYRGRSVHSVPGETVVIYPDEAHDGKAGTEQGYLYRIVHIRPSVLQEMLGGGPLPFLDAGVTRDPTLHAAVRAILLDPDVPHEAPANDDQLLDVAMALQSAFGSGRRYAGDQRAAWLARDFIDSQPSRRIDLDSLSQTSGRDRWSLSRDFRHFFGTSPSRYMTMRRLDLARQLMIAGTPLSECAVAAGFADQSHMTRHFVHAYGMTPSRWLGLQSVMPNA